MSHSGLFPPFSDGEHPSRFLSLQVLATQVRAPTSLLLPTPTRADEPKKDYASPGQMPALAPGG